MNCNCNKVNAISYFHDKYPQIKMSDLEMLNESAKEILIHLLFKSSYTVSETQRAYAYEHYHYWLIRCLQEMIERSGAPSALSNSDNGISISWNQAQLSQALRDEIVPIATVKGY